MKKKKSDFSLLILLVVLFVFLSDFAFLVVLFVVLVIMLMLNKKEKVVEQDPQYEIERKRAAYASLIAERELEKAVLMEKLDSHYWATKELLLLISDDAEGRKSLAYSHTCLLKLRNDLAVLDVKKLSSSAYDLEMSRYNSYFVGGLFVFTIF
jgi:hypothetical protein